MPSSHWRGVLRAAGYPIDGDEESQFHDRRLAPGQKRGPRAFPRLEQILRAMEPGDRLGVPDFGQFGTVAVWEWVADTFSKLGVVLEDCVTGLLLDFGTNPGAASAGADIVKARAAAAKIRPARAALEHSAEGPPGRPPLLSIEDKRQARLDWVGREIRSATAIAVKYGVSVPTIYRSMTGPDGRPVGREAARALHAAGLWIPSPAATDTH
jgi:hypothetical protein